MRQFSVLQTGNVKMPAGKKVGLAQEEFEYQKEKIRQNDITDLYINQIVTFLDELLSLKDRAITPIRRTKLEMILQKIAERDDDGQHVFRIYGFRAFIKNPREDYFLGQLDLHWDNDGQDRLLHAELFMALEVMARIRTHEPANLTAETAEQHRESLMRKWLLHEMICPVFGHESAIKLLERLYTKGKLQNIIRDTLHETESPWDSQKARNRMLEFETFSLELRPQRERTFSSLTNAEIREQLRHNWFYHIPNSCRENGDLRISAKRLIDARIARVKDRVDVLVEQSGILDEDGNPPAPFRVFISGAYFWCGTFLDDIEGNIEVDIILDGFHKFEKPVLLKSRVVKELFDIESLAKERARVSINVFGTAQLERAAKGAVQGRDELRKKLLLLPHEGIQLLGKPIDFRARHSGGVQEAHRSNLSNLAECYRDELGKSELRKPQLDWLRARVRAIESYLVNVSQVGLDDAFELTQGNVSLGKIICWPFHALFTPVRLLVSVLRELSRQRQIKASQTGETMILEPEEQAPRAMRLQLPKSDLSLDEYVTGPSHSPHAPASEELAEGIESTVQTMISFYGVPVQTGDVLQGHRGRYRLKKKLGAGAQGAVWRSEELNDRGRGVRDIAIKLPGRNAEWDWNKEGEWRAIVTFNKEIASLSKLAWHPNIIRIQDWYQDNGDVPFYVMEALSGTELSTYFDNRDFDEQEIVEMYVKLAQALAASHGEGLAHRDLKPENVMIRDADGEPVILDFGTASDMEYGDSLELTIAGAAKGTPVFMAPEMAARLVNDKHTCLVLEKDSAFCQNGCTRRYRRDEIIERIDKAEAGGEEEDGPLRVTRMGMLGRIRLRSAMRRVRPVLEQLFKSRTIKQEPVIRDCRIIESSEIKFGAYVHHGILYVEQAFLNSRPLEKILIGDPEQEYKQDIYTLGVMLYRRLTTPRPGPDGAVKGQLPFRLPKDRSDVWGAVLARLSDKYTSLGYWHKKAPNLYRKISPSLEAIVNHMLSLDPRDRYTADELVEELRRFLNASDGDELERSEGYRQLVHTARLKAAYRWMAFGVIGGFAGIFLTTMFFREFPNSLVPSPKWPWPDVLLKAYTIVVNVGIYAAFGILGVLALSGILLGLALMLSDRLAQRSELRRTIQQRVQEATQ